MILGFIQEEESESRIVNDHAVVQILGTETNARWAVWPPIPYLCDECLVKAPGICGECLLNKTFWQSCCQCWGLRGISGHDIVIKLIKEAKFCESADKGGRGPKTRKLSGRTSWTDFCFQNWRTPAAPCSPAATSTTS